MQLDALHRAGVHRVYQEKASSVGSRPELENALASLRPGHVLVVYKLDRVARSLKDLLSILDRIKASGAAVKSLNEPLDTSTPMGVFMLQVLGAVAQLERGIIRERVIAGQVAAIARGQVHGRPASLTHVQSIEVVKLWQSGQKKARIARAFGVRWHVVDRVVRLHVNPADKRYGPRRPVLGPLLEQGPGGARKI